MSADDDTEKSFEATPQKLLKAREKGEVARSADLSAAASYLGYVIGLGALGAGAIGQSATALRGLLDQPTRISALLFDGPSLAPVGGLLGAILLPVAPLFALPAACVVLVVIAQRAFLVTPSRLAPKLSRISLIANARNKFGRAGLFEFAKSFAKLVIYSLCLGWFLSANLPRIVFASATEARPAIGLMLSLLTQSLLIVLVISIAIGGLDYLWQYHEHLRKNRMSRKEVTDETKDAEGDPYMKHQRRERGTEIARNRMMHEVPQASVVIVNPTHFAVALKWSGAPGTAPVCVAKGVDEVALAIRRIAAEAGVPLHSDPPSARALFAGVAIGDEISPDHYAAVAAAIRFADQMRSKARQRGI